MSRVRTKEFTAAAQRALGDASLQRALRRISHFREARARAVQEAGPETWEAMRQRARWVKEHTLAHLDRYLEALALRVEENGGRVFFAATAEEARRYVLEVARRTGARTVIKSKSMVSEEIDLNPYLQGEGLEVVETDLGEYIIQLAGEAPFHIIAPAVHKHKEEVARLFAEKLGASQGGDIPSLAATARLALRHTFLRADLGITGANFAVAETGTIAIATNEGNGRMSATLPRVHIALMGMEKVLPRLEHLPLFLRLLTRSATGQRITSYVTLVSGPYQDGARPPREFHLVVVDNGRSRLLGDPHLREALYCIRCGACLNACPVYNKVGGHAYGWVYTGPIGKVVTPGLVGLLEAKDLPFASTLCGACREVCPLAIDIPRMLLRLRYRAVQEPGHRHRVSGVEALLMRLWSLVVGSPLAFTLAAGAGSLLQGLLMSRGRIKALPPPLSGWTSSRDFPPLASRPFRERWRQLRRGG